jgi:hypothetical protein
MPCSPRRTKVTLSVGRIGQCWDNALAESFFSPLKVELIDTRAWPTRAGGRRAVVEYIAWYSGGCCLHQQAMVAEDRVPAAQQRCMVDAADGSSNAPRRSPWSAQRHPLRSCRMNC